MAFKNDFNTDTREGKLLVCALAILQALPQFKVGNEVYKNKNADEILEILEDLNIWAEQKIKLQNSKFHGHEMV